MLVWRMREEVGCCLHSVVFHAGQGRAGLCEADDVNMLQLVGIAVHCEEENGCVCARHILISKTCSLRGISVHP